MTSVKEFRILEEPTEDRLGSGFFHFTDAYSVFDWGAMPDEIPGKGNSLCSMGAKTFETLESADIPTHYRGVTDAEVRLDDCTVPPSVMAIDLTQVPELPYRDGQYEYTAYHDAGGENFLIPLEIVFRNFVPVGSSLRRRGTPADYGLSFGTWPDERVQLAEPIVEFSTKYEEADRYLDEKEASEIAGAAAVDRLREIAGSVNEVVTELAQSAGMVHLDGKIECLYHHGDILVADVAGTFDENRFAYNGTQLSKESIRQYYRRENPDWIESLERAKEEAKERGIVDWRTICEREPMALPHDVVETISDMYAGGANAYIGHELFDAPELDTIVRAIDALNE